MKLPGNSGGCFLAELAGRWADFGRFEAFADKAKKISGITVTVFVDQGEDIVNRAVKCDMPNGLGSQFFVQVPQVDEDLNFRS
jgi:hypothetical protein